MSSTSTLLQRSLFALAAMLISGGLFYAARYYADLLLALLAAPPTPAGAVTDGPVLLVGRVRARGSVPDPIFNRGCAYFKVEITSHDEGQHSTRSETLFAQETGTPFYLVDDTGKVLVAPRSAELFVEPAVAARSGLFGTLGGRKSETPEVRALAKRYKRGGEDLSIWAHILRDGDFVLVVGRPVSGARAPEPEPEAQAERLSVDDVARTLRGPDGLSELMEKVDAGAKLPGSEPPPPTSEPAPPGALVIGAEEGGILLISDKSRARLLFGLAWKPLVLAALGLVLLSLGGTYLLTHRRALVGGLRESGRSLADDLWGWRDTWPRPERGREVD